jgi:hypothetical protein
LLEPRRRLVAGLAGVAVVLIVVGVTAIVIDPGLAHDGRATAGNSGTIPARPSSPPPSPSPTVRRSLTVVSASPGTSQPVVSSSPTVSATPTERTAGFAQQGDGFVYYAADGSTIPVTPVTGLEVRIESGKAHYYALDSNKYGLATDSYAGDFMPLVTMGQPDGSSAETGGVVLAGAVVDKLLKDKLASIAADADRWIVALPLDIRTSPPSMVDVSFDQFGLAGWSNTPRVVVRFSGSLPVVENIPNNGGYHVLVEELGVTAWQVIDPVRLGLPPGAIDPAHAMNQLLVYGNGTPSVRTDSIVDGRVPVGQVMLRASGDVSVSLVVDGRNAVLGPDKVLTIGDVPVFVASS